MSSSTAPGGGADSGTGKRGSLNKYVKRMSSVFKRDKSSKKAAASEQPTPQSTAVTAAAPSPPAPVTQPEAKTIIPAASTETPAPPSPVASESAAQSLNRSALQQERARALFAKYGLTLESHEWIAAPSQPTSVQRVEKPIRMRVHRSCHRCGTTFGADKTCSSCEHKRCKKCPRYPKKRTPAEKEAADKPKKKRVLTVHSKTGNELVYTTVQQRVRRSCCKCDALFVPPTEKECAHCRHTRCTRCPRDPAKPSKWPHGYPGDVDADSELSEVEQELARARRIWQRPKIRVRWECEECNSVFQPASAQCPGCGHERCEKCKRTPLKKSKQEPEYDPEVVRAVEEKLRALTFQRGSPVSDARAS